MQRRFSETFETVARNFEEVASTLFPGGEGRLRLVEAGQDDEGNELEAGIEVELRPAGKRITRLTLLSGGEKALGAISFLFALFLAKPCPFYLLDEVEAALDDANVDAVRRAPAPLFRPGAVHRDHAPEAHDGGGGRPLRVTMGGDGISQVVSRRLPSATGSPPQARRESTHESGDQDDFVTGGAGFVGSRLCARLAARGHKVISVDNYFRARGNEVHGVDYREAHTKDIDAAVPKQPEIVYHLGEYSRVEASISEPDVVWDLNVRGTFQVLESGVRSGQSSSTQDRRRSSPTVASAGIRARTHSRRRRTRSWSGTTASGMACRSRSRTSTTSTGRGSVRARTGR